MYVQENLFYQPNSCRTDKINTRQKTATIDTTPAHPLVDYTSNNSGDSAKRFLDIALVLLALPFALPLMALIALAIKLESPGPIIFAQPRVGCWGKVFSCFKFRSMQVDAESRKSQLVNLNEVDGPVFKIQNDPRVTRIGHFIRRSSLDELPQLFNVLQGDMSLVGPRPALPCEVITYNDYQLLRLESMPGLTGLQQVSGRSDLNFNRWIELDLQYIKKQNVRKDIEIILKTIPVVLSRKGAY